MVEGQPCMACRGVAWHGVAHRSLASRMVVWTHTSVVIPARTTLRMPRCLRTKSRSVAQNEPWPTQIAQGGPEPWANFRYLVHVVILNQNTGPGRAIRVNPVELTLPGLSMMVSPSRGVSSGISCHPGSPRTRILPIGPGSPVASHRSTAAKAE